MIQILILFVVYTWGHSLVWVFDNIEWIDKTGYQKLITLIGLITFGLAIIIGIFFLYMILK